MVELYGIARQRAGVAHCRLTLDAIGGDSTVRLDHLLDRLVAEHPALAGECIVDGAVGPACVANVDGEIFITSPSSPIREGQTLMLLSADAGG